MHSTTPSTRTKRPTLPLHLLSGRAAGPDAGARPSTLTQRRAAADADAFTLDDDSDAIPLVPLTRVHSTWEASPPPPAYTARDQSSRASRPRRVYRYVSHGIGGAGNFREWAPFFLSFLRFFFISLRCIFGGELGMGLWGRECGDGGGGGGGRGRLGL